MITCDGPITDTLSITSGYSVPCARKSNVPSVGGFRLEDIDERRADDLALLFRISHARETIEEQSRRVGKDQRQLQALEPRLDLIRLVEAHHPVVDEDAGELDRRWPCE